MSFDTSLVGCTLPETVLEYRPQDVILYALGVGAGADDLPYVFEGAAGGLRAVPSFATLAPGISGAFLHRLGFDVARSLHGEHTLTLHRPMPTEGLIRTRTEVVEVKERPSGTFVRFVSRTLDETDHMVCDNRFLIIELPEAPPRQTGTTGAQAPRAGGDPVELEVTAAIPASQALLYRLSGDRNPLHVDPAFARRAGFERPILHGLCTFGYATRILVHAACGDDPTRLRQIGARFAAPVFPGDVLTVRARHDEHRRLLFEAHTQAGVVLTHGVAVTTESLAVS